MASAPKAPANLAGCFPALDSKSLDVVQGIVLDGFRLCHLAVSEGKLIDQIGVEGMNMVDRQITISDLSSPNAVKSRDGEVSSRLLGYGVVPKEAAK